jgi:hypothetical protein
MDFVDWHPNQIKTTMKFHSTLTIILASLFFATGCMDESPLNPHDLTKPYYFQAVLDGDTVTYQEDVEGYGNIVGDFYGGELPNGWEYAPFTCLAGPAAVASGSPSPSDLAQSGAVSVVAITPAQITSLPAYRALVQGGQLGFGYLSRNPTENGTAGAFVSVYDGNGIEWNTNFGPQDSTANFSITEYYGSIDNDRFPPTQQVFAAEFNCKVYNAAGASKVLTAGKVRGRLIIF